MDSAWTVPIVVVIHLALLIGGYFLGWADRGHVERYRERPPKARALKGKE